MYKECFIFLFSDSTIETSESNLPLMNEQIIRNLYLSFLTNHHIHNELTNDQKLKLQNHLNHQYYLLLN